jgi:hypothetical protein
MKSFTINLVKVGLLGAFCFVGLAQAATVDGTVGATSTGTTDVSVTIPDRVRVSRLDGIALGTYGGSGDMSGVDDLCVFRNGSGSYKIQLDSANPGGANEFQMKNGTNFITYTVKFDDDADASDQLAVTSGTEISGLTGHSTSASCGAADNGQLRIDVLEVDLLAAPPAAYLDTVTLLVTPI